MLPYIATYILFAVILAIVDRFTDRPLFIRTHSKHFPWKLNYSVRWWGAQEYCAAIILASIAALLLIFFWWGMGGEKSTNVARIIFGVICLSSSVLSIKHFRLVEKLKAHAWWMTILTALATLVLSLVASAYADSFIVNWTRIDASQFPLAQKALSALILITLWAYIASTLISLGVGITFVVITAVSPTFIGVIKGDRLKTESWKRYKPDLTHRRRSSTQFALYTGAYFTVVITMNAWDYVLGHAEEVLQETLVFSSFHLHPRDCGIPRDSRDIWTALVSENRAVIATPAKLGYTYETVGCTIQSSDTMKKPQVKQLKRSDYQ
ncbi:hypothetical protein [Pseudomonas sp. UMAB-08]|uniref:hypothetical protein n=1 Tax=Pseudomonas sp. UMAB-08 TaxID=1365375 RepID=UPI001C565899|nr:hypothetical protein [Pseudomonas sp. UMAB-08]